MDEEKVFQINVREILRTKAPQLHKKTPGFLISALEKLIYQKELNSFLRDSHGYTGVAFMEQAMKYFNITLVIQGEENIPPITSPCIFASNHPLGGLDGICLSAFLGKKYEGNIRYLVNDILYFIKPLQNIFIPINKHGAQAKGGVQMLNDAFASKNQIITFPAGVCSRKINGKITDLEWKKMFIVKAVEYERSVVPVYFQAQNTGLFYAISNIRKKLGIKFNIEMLLLPREMFKAKNKTFTIHFGETIPCETFSSSQTPQKWADWVKNKVYNII